MKQKLIRFSGYGLFWSWNLIFTLLLLFLLFPEIIIPIITGTLTGTVFFLQGLFALMLFVVPIFSILLGLTKNIRCDPVKLLKLFYGLELPLLFLVIARLTLFRELQPGTIHIMVLSIMAPVGYGLYLYSQKGQECSILRQIIQQFLITCSFLIALYIALLLLFFVLPMGKQMLLEFVSFDWFSVLFKHPLIFLVVLFVFYTFTLLIGLPIMLITLYGRAFIKDSQKSFTHLGKVSVLLIIISTIGINSVIFYWANQQDQVIAFSLLESPMDNMSQKRELISQQESIRLGLLNSYLASYRYLSTTSSSRAIEKMYVKSFGLDRQGIPKTLQKWFNALVSPFLYQGNQWTSDERKAEKLYLEFFDSPIDKAERQAINQALKSNWYRDGMQAGLINKDKQKVLITKQTITIEEMAHSAKVTLNESYQNQTFERQEIYYYFTLPEEAVITGVWLSDDVDKPKKYAYTVAPRGAAQKLYKQERERRVDPALLEQIGPMQYRLRIFPIPAKRKASKSLNVTVDSLYMQLDYHISLSMNKRWVLPMLLEKRNVYWQKATPILVNGVSYDRPYNQVDREGQWLPETIAAQSATPLSQLMTQIPKTEHQLLEVMIRRRSANIETTDEMDKLLSKQQSLAILIDTSFSMQKQIVALQKTLQQLISVQNNSAILIDFFVLSDKVKPIEVNEWIQSDPVMFGHTTSLKQLHQWQDYSKDKKEYQATILLTDAGNYEVKEKLTLEPNHMTPMWLLHLGSEPAYAYADSLLDLIIQSGGGVGHDLDDILYRFLWKQQRKDHALSEISQDYIWQYRLVEKKENYLVGNNELGPIIAHQWINAGFNRQNASQTSVLDDLHQMAKQYSLVSPYSSMIVLVNERQEKELEALSKEADRFKRDTETGKKSLVKGNDLFQVSSVPEPEEWALIIVVLILLSVAIVKKKHQKNHYLIAS